MPDNLDKVVEDAFTELHRGREQFIPSFTPSETGAVISVSPGIATVSGLPEVGYSELLKFPGDLYGIAFNLDETEIGVVLLGDGKLGAGDEVQRTGRVVDIPVGNAVIGRVISPLGEPLDGRGAIAFAKRLPIERPAQPIMNRAPVIAPLQTGTKVIDALIPIGRGQRELILGDRQTGKTAIALDTILNQKDKNVICIYCAIGQRASSVAKVIDRLTTSGAMSYTCVVVTEGNNPPGLQYIAPYAATSIAEYFMEEGRDVLIVYDDLSNHAEAYRELSLLLRRPPGREAFPGDIFYIHSRLLERSTHLKSDLGGGSLTALPVIQTEAQNISAYISTNLISITDGQIYLSPKLFELGVLPAIDVEKSVSRVGGKAQLPVFSAATGDLKLAYAQFEELETFARFGASLDKNTRKMIEHGKRIREIFKQPELQPLSVARQILLLLALQNGLLESVPVNKIQAAEAALYQAADQLPAELAAALFSESRLSQEDKDKLLGRASAVLAAFLEIPDTPKTAGNE